MNVIEIVTKARDAERRYNLLLEEASHMQRLLTQSEKVGARNAPCAFGQYLQKLDLEANRYVALRRRAEELIDSVPDGTCRELLARRYLCGDKWENIAEAMHFSNPHIFRLRAKAMALLQKTAS